MITYPKQVVIEEQGLRDGLQNETTLVPTEKKLALSFLANQQVPRHVKPAFPSMKSRFQFGGGSLGAQH